jgi:Zn-dependent alcohol dehydrogenase
MKGGGKTIILGAEMHDSPLCLDSYEILSGKCVMGSLFRGIKANTDIPTLVNKYLNKVILHTLLQSAVFKIITPYTINSVLISVKYVKQFSGAGA